MNINPLNFFRKNKEDSNSATNKFKNTQITPQTKIINLRQKYLILIKDLSEILKNHNINNYNSDTIHNLITRLKSIEIEMIKYDTKEISPQIHWMYLNIALMNIELEKFQTEKITPQLLSQIIDTGYLKIYNPSDLQLKISNILYIPKESTVRVGISKSANNNNNNNNTQQDRFF